MELLKQRILREGVADSVLKVDSVLNHQLDVVLFNEMAQFFWRKQLPW